MKTPEFNEARLLGLFLNPDHYREQIREPFLSDGYVCATETHRLIMIKPTLCKGEYKPNKLHVLETIPPNNIDITITFAALKRAIKSISSEPEFVTIRPAVVCNECGGDGEVEWEYTDSDRRTHHRYYVCPICKGTGESIPAVTKPTGRRVPSDEAVIGIYEHTFRAPQILKLCDAMQLLGLDKLRYIASNPNGGNVFELTDGISVVICNCASSKTKVWVSPKYQ